MAAISQDASTKTLQELKDARASHRTESQIALHKYEVMFQLPSDQRDEKVMNHYLELVKEHNTLKDDIETKIYERETVYRETSESDNDDDDEVTDDEDRSNEALIDRYGYLYEQIAQIEARNVDEFYEGELDKLKEHIVACIAEIHYRSIREAKIIDGLFQQAFEGKEAEIKRQKETSASMSFVHTLPRESFAKHMQELEAKNLLLVRENTRRKAEASVFLEGRQGSREDVNSKSTKTISTQEPAGEQRMEHGNPKRAAETQQLDATDAETPDALAEAAGFQPGPGDGARLKKMARRVKPAVRSGHSKDSDEKGLIAMGKVPGNTDTSPQRQINDGAQLNSASATEDDAQTKELGSVAEPKRQKGSDESNTTIENSAASTKNIASANEDDTHKKELESRFVAASERMSQLETTVNDLQQQIIDAGGSQTNELTELQTRLDENMTVFRIAVEESKTAIKNLDAFTKNKTRTDKMNYAANALRQQAAAVTAKNLIRLEQGQETEKQLAHDIQMNKTTEKARQDEVAKARSKADITRKEAEQKRRLDLNPVVSDDQNRINTLETLNEASTEQLKTDKKKAQTAMTADTESTKLASVEETNLQLEHNIKMIETTEKARQDEVAKARSKADITRKEAEQKRRLDLNPVVSDDQNRINTLETLNEASTEQLKTDKKKAQTAMTADTESTKLASVEETNLQLEHNIKMIETTEKARQGEFEKARSKADITRGEAAKQRKLDLDPVVSRTQKRINELEILNKASTEKLKADKETAQTATKTDAENTKLSSVEETRLQLVHEIKMIGEKEKARQEEVAKARSKVDTTRVEADRKRTEEMKPIVSDTKINADKLEKENEEGTAWLKRVKKRIQVIVEQDNDEDALTKASNESEDIANALLDAENKNRERIKKRVNENLTIEEKRSASQKERDESDAVSKQQEIRTEAKQAFDKAASKLTKASTTYERARINVDRSTKKIDQISKKIDTIRANRQAIQTELESEQGNENVALRSKLTEFDFTIENKDRLKQAEKLEFARALMESTETAAALDNAKREFAAAENRMKQVYANIQIDNPITPEPAQTMLRELVETLRLQFVEPVAANAESTTTDNKPWTRDMNLAVHQPSASPVATTPLPATPVQHNDVHVVGNILPGFKSLAINENAAPVIKHMPANSPAPATDDSDEETENYDGLPIYLPNGNSYFFNGRFWLCQTANRKLCFGDDLIVA